MNRKISLVLALLALGAFPIAHAQQAESEDTELVEELIQQGREHFANEDWERAVEHFQTAFKLGKRPPEEYFAVAQVMLYELDQQKEAIKLLEDGQKVHKNNDAIGVLLGNAYNMANQYEKAFKQFEAIEPHLVPIKSPFLTDAFYFSFGAAAERTKRFEDAEELFLNAIDLTPRQAPERAALAYNYLGYMWVEQGKKLEEAGGYIKKALEFFPDSGAYMDSLGWYHYMKGEYVEALKVLKKAERALAAEEQPDDVVFDHLGQTYFKLGHLDKATEYVKKAAKLAPDNKEYTKRLGTFKKSELPETVPLDFLNEG